MARIPDAEVERLKSSISLQRLVEAKGVTLERHGKDWLGRCPFHDDRTPSLVVSPAKNLWHCLGACATGGTVIDWVMRAEGVSFRHAVELLRNDAPLTGHVVKQATVPKLAAPVEADADDAAALAQVIDYYHATLKQSPEALAYLESRGLASNDLIDRFKLGFANRTLGLRLPEKNRKAGAEVRSRLQRLGVLRESGHEHFNGSLVVPVFDVGGNVVEVYGRKITPNLRPGTPLHLYLPGPHAGVFNREALADPEIILCESLLDALTFWQAGYRNVTCAYGVNGFTDEHRAALRDTGTQRVLIAYDRDAAGDAAAAKLAEVLMADGIECYRIQFPKGMDANEYALKVIPAAKSLGMVIRKAEWLGAGKPRTQRDVAPEATAVSREEDAALPASSDLPLAAAVDREAEAAAKEEAANAIDVTFALPASPVPTLPPVPVEVGERDVTLTLGERRYRVRGLAKNLAYDTLKVNLLVSSGERFYVDTLDLYAARARGTYTTQAAVELGVSEDIIRADLGRVLLQLEALQDDAIKTTLMPATVAPVIAPELEAAALDLLRDPRLVERIVADVASVGVVGEDSNALVGYLAAVSRKLDKPLAVLIQSTSAAGKSTLMDALLSLMPERERVHYSAMTGQSLFYLGEGDLKHKILAIAEEEGVRQAAYALKLLQSQGELTIASTGKDPTTGKLVTEEYRVEGPVMLVLTTTAIDLDEELLNRCVVLTINESREQTAAIHTRQRQARTLAGLLAGKDADRIRAVHRAAQTLLKPLAVVNPYAEALTFRSESTRMRRDHAKYLTLIDAIAFLHQHQRPVKTAIVAGATIEYVEVTRDDIALANRLAGEVLGRSLDELPPQTRRVLSSVVALVETRMREQAIPRAAVRFTRKELRAIAGITDTALRLHVERLVELEYLLIHRGANGQRFVYELLFDGDVTLDMPQLIGLIDVAALESMGTTANLAPQTANLAPTLHPKNTPLAPTLHGAAIPLIASTDAGSSSLVAASKENPLPEPREPARRRSHNGATALA
ncbi:toprim domain-containing protein [Lysobacter pythonis]|uniref:Toprim domain-containing protein n=1 Tax=Solilutibacter pythonis TaxID=2483112 RepID=A0A3M2HHS3_9GAMM|nr:CHC2 zinc finger domain-containing protein [Lysobacter pythonis]RMH87483.1 toprim domain-containing protein [Lysobacter pythonis]